MVAIQFPVSNKNAPKSDIRMEKMGEKTPPQRKGNRIDHRGGLGNLWLGKQNKTPPKKKKKRARFVTPDAGQGQGEEGLLYECLEGLGKGVPLRAVPLEAKEIRKRGGTRR